MKMEIQKVFEYALSREYEGKRFFVENANRLNHAAAVNAFQQLAVEEQKHIDFIQRQIDLLKKGQTENVDYGLRLEQAGFFSQRAQSEIIDQTVAEAMIPDLPVLRMACLIERDFADFYENSASQATGETKKVLEMLAKWERTHELLFKSLHDKAFEAYSQMPWGG
jgi:rubrerythrin